MSFLTTSHKTFVHHLALDPSGTLLATCSSDKTVGVFYRRQSTGGEDVWEHGCTMEDHTGPVLRLAWCQHREHGPLLSTAGADHWIYIYRIAVSTHEGHTVTQAMRWSPVRGFEKDAITDVAFIPPQQYHVLLLSTASLDGCVRLYEIHQPLQFPCMCKLTPEADFAAMEEGAALSDGIGGGGGGGGPGAAGEAVNKTPPTLSGASGGSMAPYRGMGSSLQARSSTGSVHGSGASLACLPPASGGGAGGCAGAGSVSGAAAAGNTTSSGAAGSDGASGGGTQGGGGYRGAGGIVSISWFPGAAESTMTLAVGAVSGRFFLYRYLKDSNTFTPLRLMDDLGVTGLGVDGAAGIRCRMPVEDVEWAPPMGRRFQLCAICSRAEVCILRLNCISPANHDTEGEGPIHFEVFRLPMGAVSASWSRSATLLYLAMDDRKARMAVLQMHDPRDHHSWHVVSQHDRPSMLA